MNSAIAKTISLFLLIMVGFFLRKKIKSKEQKEGLKIVILSVALPSIIFIGLQKINFSVDMLIFPIAALVFNLCAFASVSFLSSVFKLDKDSSYARTLKMLVPSLAPGLSCFPFLLEYFGEPTLANAAIADIGNKIFVLIILYLLALKWYHKSEYVEYSDKGSKLKSLLKSLISEPVNMVILLGVGLLLFGINYDSFPAFLSMTVDKMSLIMTPLVLMFIGISVKLDWAQIKTIWSVLLFRSGFAFFFSGLILAFFPATSPALSMLIVLFPQSSCSFWPYAHMSAINAMGEAKNTKPVFDMDLGMNILALSLPLSTIIILGLSTYGEKSSSPVFVFTLAGILIGASVLPQLVKNIAGKYLDKKMEVSEN